MDHEKVIYVNENRVFMRIPVRELVPGVVWGGDEELGPIWLPIWLHPAVACREWGHPPLTEEARGNLRDLQTELHEVYPLTIEEWEADIQGTRNPDIRLCRWLGLVTVYQALITEGGGLDGEGRAAIFRLLKSYIDYPAEHALSLAGDYAPLSREEAARVIEIIRDFFAVNLNPTFAAAFLKG